MNINQKYQLNVKGELFIHYEGYKSMSFKMLRISHKAHSDTKELIQAELHERVK